MYYKGFCGAVIKGRNSFVPPSNRISLKGNFREEVKL